jgi:hypothetical protein
VLKQYGLNRTVALVGFPAGKEFRVKTSQLDVALPRKIVSAVVLTEDVAVSVRYRTASGREANSEAKVFNIVGGDGAIAKVSEAGGYISFANCPKCNAELMFGNGGLSTKRQIEKRKKAFERDLRGTCPNHERSRVKFWF